MLAILLASGLAIASPDATHLNPQRITQHIRSQGAMPVVNRLLKSGRWWKLIDLITEGRPEWIALTPALSPGTDAATAESLRSGLAYALPRSPLETLRVLIESKNSPTSSLKEVCGLPFYDKTRAQTQRYKQTTLAVLKRVKSPRLKAAAAACAAEMQSLG